MPDLRAYADMPRVSHVRTYPNPARAARDRPCHRGGDTHRRGDPDLDADGYIDQHSYQDANRYPIADTDSQRHSDGDSHINRDGGPGRLGPVSHDGWNREWEKRDGAEGHDR